MDLFRSGTLPPDLLAEVRRLQFQARRLADEGTIGKYRSAFRGHGLEFEEVREYFPGDEIRTIDWKVTARSGRPHVKSFREERELSVMIAVDVSHSTRSGTRGQSRAELIAQLGAVLSLIALRNNDKVGLVTYSDKLESYHPPRKARGAIWRILHEVLTPESQGRGTDLPGLLRFLSLVLKRRSIVFLLSDFPTCEVKNELAVLGRRHDVTAVLVEDASERELPDAGLLVLRDPETGFCDLVDTSVESFRQEFAKRIEAARETLRGTCRECGVQTLELTTGEPFMPMLRHYFERRQFAHRSPNRMGRRGS